MSWLELVWVGASVVATLFCAWGLRDTMVDMAFLIASGLNGPRKTIAESNQRAETFRLVKCVAMLLASVTSLMLPPPPPPYHDLPQSLVGLVAWLIIAGALILHSLSDRLSRRRLARYSAQEQPRDPVTGYTVLEKGPDAAPSGPSRNPEERTRIDDTFK